MFLVSFFFTHSDWVPVFWIAGTSRDSYAKWFLILASFYLKIRKKLEVLLPKQRFPLKQKQQQTKFGLATFTSKVLLCLTVKLTRTRNRP